MELSSIRTEEDRLMRKIVGCYDELSPENLHCDGEISARQARAKAVEIKARLRALEKELGRRVPEEDAYLWMQKMYDLAGRGNGS